MTRITDTLSNMKHPALVTFITACDPDFERSVSILKTLPEAGADLIELGIPFTDPMADGETIQHANIRALNNGASMTSVLNMVREFRRDNQTTPIILMGYMNPIFHYGAEKFINDINKAGVDGIIIVDLPPEESGEIETLAQTQNIDLVRLITPTTEPERINMIARKAQGFLYYVSITGVTGSAKPNPKVIQDHMTRIKAQTDLPIAVGFGIKTPEDAKAIGQHSDAIVVGSALVQTIADHADDPNLVKILSTQVSALSNALKS